MRHNVDEFREITQTKLDCRDYVTEDWHGRDALSRWIRGPDIERYLATTGATLSVVAFDPKRQDC